MTFTKREKMKPEGKYRRTKLFFFSCSSAFYRRPPAVLGEDHGGGERLEWIRRRRRCTVQQQEEEKGGPQPRDRTVSRKQKDDGLFAAARPSGCEFETSWRHAWPIIRNLPSLLYVGCAHMYPFLNTRITRLGGFAHRPHLVMAKSTWPSKTTII